MTLLDRRRSGARISREGQDLLRGMEEVLEAVDRLRRLAGDQRAAHRAIRIGTVHAGTARLLLPAIRGYEGTRPGATVEISNLQQERIERGLAEGALDLGLVNLLTGDDVPPDLVGIALAHGRPVAVLPADHPLAALEEVTADDLREQRVRRHADRLPHAPVRAPPLRQPVCRSSGTRPTAPRWAR